MENPRWFCTSPLDVFFFFYIPSPQHITKIMQKGPFTLPRISLFIFVEIIYFSWSCFADLTFVSLYFSFVSFMIPPLLLFGFLLRFHLDFVRVSRVRLLSLTDHQLRQRDWFDLDRPLTLELCSEGILQLKKEKKKKQINLVAIWSDHFSLLSGQHNQQKCGQPSSLSFRIPPCFCCASFTLFPPKQSKLLGQSITRFSQGEKKTWS